MNPAHLDRLAVVVSELATIRGIAGSTKLAAIGARTVARQITEQAREHGVQLLIDMTRTDRESMDEVFQPVVQKRVSNLGEPLREFGVSQRLWEKFQRLNDNLEPERFETARAEVLLEELLHDLLSELTEPQFLSIATEKRELYAQTEPPFGVLVEAAFPQAVKDSRAAGRCLALDEWTACVFHCMRVLEIGLRPIAARFGVPFATDSWHTVLRGIEDGLTHLRNQKNLNDKDRAEITFYSEAAIQFRHFKDAWRNHVSHARESYDEREATRVYDHVRDFMQHMAKGAK